MQWWWVLLVSTLHNADRSVSVFTKDITIATVDQDILVLWKWSYHRKRTVDVGDGMDVIVAFPRSEIALSLDQNLVEQALGLYQEFDEVQNETKSYVYWCKNTEDHRNTVNALLDSLQIENSLTLAWSFTALQNSVQPLDHEQVRQQWIWWAVSVLFWLFVWYGKFVWDDDLLHHATISVPMVWSIAQHEPLFDWLVQECAEHGLFVRHEYQQARHGQVWSVWIYDWELLQYFKLRSDDQRTVTKLDQIQAETPRIIDFLRDAWVNEEVLIMLQSGIFKVCKR